ncbi:MAG: exodeoxyribonuclease VII small subunit [Muribaculaceae bacterium]|nr:exodeoxyribonuclease VII small subunit [Muribaculaceae bacterium]
MEEKGYTQAITEVENIIKEMQSDNCDIDKLITNTKRAAELIEFCRRKLTLTETELQTIINSLEEKSSDL